MKIYTQPRPLQTWQLRPGDHIAMRVETEGRDLPITTTTEFMDLDLTDGVSWSAVHTTIAQKRSAMWVVHHSDGTAHVDDQDTFIVREVVEIEPWSYVRSA